MAVIKDPLSERLACLSEELGEGVQAIGKCTRHGLNSNWAGGPTNRKDLARELGQVRALTELLVAAGDIDEKDVRQAEVDKYENIVHYLHTKKNKDLCMELRLQCPERR